MRNPPDDNARFIPARAGNRDKATNKAMSAAVHPRACGEQKYIPEPLPDDLGSSPRVRGTVREVLTADFGQRFIPARAGNSPSRVPTAYSGAVHPRACGEQND